MNASARLFVRTSVVYLVAASLGGVYLFVDRNHPVQLTSAHSHLLLIGWVTLGLAGALMARGEVPVGLARAGWLLANVGLLSMTGAWVLEARALMADLTWVMAGAGTLELAGLLLIAAAVWKASGAQVARASRPPR